MKIRTGTIVLILICIGLIGALRWSRKQAHERRKVDEVRIGSYSNKWVETSASLEEQRQINTSLESELQKQRKEFNDLTNVCLRVSTALEQTEASLKNARADVARRDASIADLKMRNEALDRRALDLGSAIANLAAQIEDARRKLAASEGLQASPDRQPTNPPAVK
jgi:chromosome segregation ATPase